MHFCVRHHFSSTCEVLTHQFDRASLQKSLALRGFDGKTPLDISEDNEDTDLYMLLKASSVYSINAWVGVLFIIFLNLIVRIKQSRYEISIKIIYNSLSDSTFP